MEAFFLPENRERPWEGELREMFGGERFNQFGLIFCFGHSWQGKLPRNRRETPSCSAFWTPPV